MYLKPVLSFVCEQKTLTNLLKVTKCQHFLQQNVDPNSFFLSLSLSSNSKIFFHLISIVIYSNL